MENAFFFLSLSDSRKRRRRKWGATARSGNGFKMHQLGRSHSEPERVHTDFLKDFKIPSQRCCLGASSLLCTHLAVTLSAFFLAASLMGQIFLEHLLREGNAKHMAGGWFQKLPGAGCGLETGAQRLKSGRTESRAPGTQPRAGLGHYRRQDPAGTRLGARNAGTRSPWIVVVPLKPTIAPEAGR